jgi:arylsulfatase A-like enzyme
MKCDSYDFAKLKRRDFLKILAAGTAAGSISINHRGIASMNENRNTNDVKSDKKPNILFLFTDDQRFDTINILGNEDIVTPNMDSLASGGAAFTHACIMGSMSGAVCMPSRAQLMSGRTLFRAPDDLADVITFPEVLKEAGYTTFATGKWHNQPGSYARCFTNGAKIFFGGMSNHLEVPVNDFDPTGKYPKEKRYTGDKFSSELFSDAVINFLNEYEKDAPFLAYVPYTAPHDPRMPPKKYKDMYNPKNIPVPENFMPKHPFDNGEMEIRDEKLAPWPRTPEIIQQHIADYYGMITHLDDEIGRILENLKDLGHADNTVIIFAGDNGLAVGQHGLMGKQNLYDHSIRVPLIINGPGIPKQQKNTTLCYLLDLFPTICDITGIPVPDGVEGENLMPVIRGEKDKIRENQYYAYKSIHRAVRDDQYKLIEYYINGNRMTQLFNLYDDPWEVNNLADDPDYSNELKGLRDELVRWQKEVDDPLLTSAR